MQFSRLVKGLLASIRDENFFEILKNVESRLSSIAWIIPKIDIEPSLLKHSEIKCVNAMMAMEDFRTLGGVERLAIVMHSYTRNLFQLTDHTYHDDFDDSSSLRQGFQSFVKSLTSATLPQFMKIFFDLVNSYGLKYAEAFCIELTSLIKNIPSAYLCIFVSELFRQMERVHDQSLSLLVDALSELLLSNRGPLGYSALEISGNLLKIMRRQKPAAPFSCRSSFLKPSEGLSPPPKSIFTICNCLGIYQNITALAHLLIFSFDFEK